MPPLQKNFYEEHEDVTNMTPEYVEEIRKQNNNITASRVFLDETGETKDVDPVPNPIEKFEQCFGQYPDLMGNFLVFYIISIYFPKSSITWNVFIFFRANY